jgi:hypothetical protein
LFIHFLGKSHITKHQRDQKVKLSLPERYILSLAGTEPRFYVVHDITDEQNRKYTYNVTSRRVHETTVPVEKQQVLHISVCVDSRARVYVYVVRVCVCVCVGARARACAGAHVALLIHHAMLRHIVIRGLCLHDIFDIISKMARFPEKRYCTQNVHLDFLHSFYLK